MAELTSKSRNALADRIFALPGRRFPIPDKAHAQNAKARATQGLKAGTLSAAQAATVRRKANRKLGE
jgi:hypothetical protein